MTKPITAVKSSTCQSEALPGASWHVSKLSDLAYRACTHRRRYSFRKTVQEFGAYFRRLVQKPQSGSASTTDRECQVTETVLALQPGEFVEVKSDSEIAATLDARGTLRGLAFLPAMRPFCGKRFVVLRRVERIYLEESAKTRKMKSTVLLNGAMCDGLLMGCDRSCFFYWREDWLRRVVAG
jgi:hypothetical protein